MEVVYNFVEYLLNNYLLANVETFPDVLQWYCIGITLIVWFFIFYLPILAIYKFIKYFDRGII